jgi:hypothetical protein
MVVVGLTNQSKQMRFDQPKNKGVTDKNDG